MMKDAKKILCVIDPTVDAQPAMQRAAWIASKSGATLELFVCLYDEFSGSPFLFSDESVNNKAKTAMIERQEKQLNELAGPLRDQGIEVAISVGWDRPLYEGIIRKAVSCNANMVVKDTHHHSVLDRALLTHTDWNLIRTCPTPLWLVKQRDFNEPPVVLAAIDPTHDHDKPATLDHSILGMARVLGDVLGADVHAFHAFDPSIAVASGTAGAYVPISLPYDVIEKEMREAHTKSFNAVLENYAIEDDHRHLVNGATHQELPATASELAADIVIMGAIARNAWKRLFIGATAERTLEGLPCDLVIIKPDWFESPVEANGTDAAA